MFERLMKQAIMNRVLFSLIPILIFSIYLFGWRVAVVVAVSNISAFAAEYMFVAKKKGGKVTMAVFVTGTLLGMTLPPTIPLWMPALGSVFAIVFGKMVFGGFGANIFNPAILGRTFLYISFPEQMTVRWLKPFVWSDFPGGFLRWTADTSMHTSATIMNSLKQGLEIGDTFLGTILGFEPGSIGETSALLLLFAGVYLLITKTAKWIPMLATTISILLFNLIFYPAQNPLFLLCTGGAVFGIVFMVTDPVSQPKTNTALWIYGILVGFLTVFIRRYSLFVEGFMFALLLTNAFMPIIEYGLKSLPKKKAVANA